MVRLCQATLTGLPPRRHTIETMLDLVLLRHGQSTWNAKNLFTGWVDVDLSPAGEAEARAGGDLLAEAAAASSSAGHAALPSTCGSSTPRSSPGPSALPSSPWRPPGGAGSRSVGTGA